MSRRAADGPPSRWRRGADLAALALCAVYLATTVPTALEHAASSLALGFAKRGETEAEARARVRPPGFAAAIDAIRRTLPASEPYLLVEENELQKGAAFWVRYELAPRRAVRLRGGERSAGWIRRNVPGGLRWVVVARDRDQPPVLLTRYDFLHALEGAAR